MAAPSQYFSFVVQSPDEVPLEAFSVFLDPGLNIFNLMVEDIEFFKEVLRARGVSIIRYHRLDELVSIDPTRDVLQLVGGNS